MRVCLLFIFTYTACAVRDCTHRVRCLYYIHAYERRVRAERRDESGDIRLGDGYIRGRGACESSSGRDFPRTLRRRRKRFRGGGAGRLVRTRALQFSGHCVRSPPPPPSVTRQNHPPPHTDSLYRALTCPHKRSSGRERVVNGEPAVTKFLLYNRREYQITCQTAPIEKSSAAVAFDVHADISHVNPLQWRIVDLLFFFFPDDSLT